MRITKTIWWRLIVSCVLLGGIGAALAFYWRATESASETYFSSYHDGKRYDFHFTHSELKAAPSWKPWSDSPPLAPRKAERLAREVLTHAIPDSKNWWVESISLEQVGLPFGQEWIYVVTFTWHDGVMFGQPAQMRIPILMNGKAVVPTISDRKDQ